MTDRPVVCPVCHFVGETTRVYRHLQVEHRKSALADALVEGAATPRERPPAGPSNGRV